MGWRLMPLVAVGLLLTLAWSGCSTKKKPVEETGEFPGLAEEEITTGSLEKYQAGTLGTGEDGPLKDAHFNFDSFELDEPARQALRENSEWLRRNSKAKVEIEGHCDERGTTEYNLALGAKRARAAKDYLVVLGISSERLTTISFGEELPGCREHEEACWQRNRRAHFVLLAE